MTNKYLDALTQVVRHPRHCVQDRENVQIELERIEGLPGGNEEPDVLDFSRGGCRLRGSAELNKLEPIVLRICDNISGLTLELPATVRWSRSIEFDRFEAGCQFDQAVDYEHLGELFLAGFLSTEEVVFE